MLKCGNSAYLKVISRLGFLAVYRPNMNPLEHQLIHVSTICEPEGKIYAPIR